MYTDLESINQLQYTKGIKVYMSYNKYEIKLYRSLQKKIIYMFFALFYSILLGISIVALFYKDNNFDSISFIILFIVFNISMLILLLFTFFNKKILVKESYIKVCFLPRIYKKMYKEKIYDIVLIDPKEKISIYDFLNNYLYDRENLYRIIYNDKSYFVNCKDDKLYKLIKEISEMTGESSVS